MERLLPPTDCRLRPDIRAMENGDMGKGSASASYVPVSRKARASSSRDPVFNLCFVDTANTEKERLEEKQRAARKDRSKDEDEWSARWVCKTASLKCSCVRFISESL